MTSLRHSQNFLRMSPFLARLVERTSISPQDIVLDIGAGTGALTMLLSARSRAVLAIEADPRLVSKLRLLFAETLNVEVRHGDFLEMELPKDPYKVFANIPFNRTSEIVRKLLDGPTPPEDSYLILQREAAEKFAGSPGHQSLFSVLHAPWFAMSIVHNFRTTDFMPQPSVATVLLRCQKRHDDVITPEHRGQFEDFVAYIFNHANPNVLPSLQKLFPGKQFERLTITFGANTTAKPSQLALAVWISLFDAFQQSATQVQRRLVHGTAAKLSQDASKIEKHHRTRSAANWREV